LKAQASLTLLEMANMLMFTSWQKSQLKKVIKNK